MGKIHEVQEELVANIKKRKDLEQQVKDLKREVESLKRQKEILLQQRPAPLAEGWKMPTSPKCGDCGADIPPEAYMDVDEVSLSWAEWCPECGAEFDCDAHHDDWDTWPFAVETVWESDLLHAGFVVE